MISSNSAVAKGVLTGHGHMHICDCHVPLRYAFVASVMPGVAHV